MKLKKKKISVFQVEKVINLNDLTENQEAYGGPSSGFNVHRQRELPNLMMKKPSIVKYRADAEKGSVFFVRLSTGGPNITC